MISVCMASCNGERYIVEQVLSILRQLDATDELVISDDASTDKTLSELTKIHDARIKIFANSSRRGYTRNFENGLQKCTGDIIFLSDQDDVWLDGKVSKTIHFLHEFDFVVSDAILVNSDLNPLGVTYFEMRGGGKGLWRNLWKTRYIGACMAFRRSVLLKALPFPLNSNLATHDLWLSLVSALFFNVKVIDEPLVLYRRHANNVSGGGLSMGFSIAKKIRYRIYVMWMLVKRCSRKEL